MPDPKDKAAAATVEAPTVEQLQEALAATEAAAQEQAKQLEAQALELAELKGENHALAAALKGAGTAQVSVQSKQTEKVLFIELAVITVGDDQDRPVERIIAEPGQEASLPLDSAARWYRRKVAVPAGSDEAKAWKGNKKAQEASLDRAEQRAEEVRGAERAREGKRQELRDRRKQRTRRVAKASD